MDKLKNIAARTFSNSERGLRVVITITQLLLCNKINCTRPMDNLKLRNPNILKVKVFAFNK
jgi:hypothetical protein